MPISGNICEYNRTSKRVSHWRWHRIRRQGDVNTIKKTDLALGNTSGDAFHMAGRIVSVLDKDENCKSGTHTKSNSSFGKGSDSRLKGKE